MKGKKLILLFAVVLLTACANHKTGSSDEQGDTIPMKYARNLTMVRHDGYTEVTIRNPWDTTTVLHRYVLLIY